MTISHDDAQALLDGNYPMQNDSDEYTMTGTKEDAVIWSKARELAQTVVVLHEENERLKRRINDPTY